MIKKITVIGSTGMIGTTVTKELVKAGFEVTALVRNIEKAKNILPIGVHFVKGDLDNPSSIAESLKGADGLYINISTRPEDKENAFCPEVDGLKNILEAAKNANIKQMVYLSSLIARDYRKDWWVMLVKKTSINKIKNCGVPYTIFYPSSFMENFPNGMIQGKKVTLMGKPVHKMWWIATEDFGRQVANSFKTEKAVNKEYVVQGTEGLTMKEAAEIFAKNYSKSQLSVAVAPIGIFKFLGLFITQLKFVSRMMEVLLDNVETFESQTTWDELGKPTITVKEFAKNI